MAFLGGHNPLPELVGGGPNRIEKASAAMKSAVGIGGSAVDGTIEAEWRFARATGAATVASSDERAFWQTFPDTATDHIPLYEDLLNVSPPTGASDQDRRDEITTDYLFIPNTTNPGLLVDLIALDSRLSILNPAEAEVRIVQAGRFFQPFATTATDPIYNLGRTHTNFPNFSDRFVLYVFFDIGSGSVPTVAENAIVTEVEELLLKTLPAWCSFRIIFDQTAFILDTSLLDLGVP